MADFRRASRAQLMTIVYDDPMATLADRLSAAAELYRRRQQAWRQQQVKVRRTRRG